jgi:hypothetical protein
MSQEGIVKAVQNEVVGCKGVKTTNWHAWNNKMPPKPDDFHVTGQVEVPNYGVAAKLVYRVPQGIKEKILLLDLVLIQQPGIWPSAVTLAQARYDQTPPVVDYDRVEIFCGKESIASVKVEDIH